MVVLKYDTQNPTQANRVTQQLLLLELGLTLLNLHHICYLACVAVNLRLHQHICSRTWELQ